MSVKRRDNKNRILRDRESQCKDGRYRYTYYEDGKQKALYSWKLEATDKLPIGKRQCVALRVQIRELKKKELYDHHINPNKLSVLQLAETYCSLRNSVKITTKDGYYLVLNLLRNDPFGKRQIDQLRTIDCKRWLIQLQKSGKHFGTLKTVRGVLKPAFQMAVEDDDLIKNPFDFNMSSILVNDAVPRTAISEEQMDSLLEFIKNDVLYSRFYEAILILFNTGLRISEFCGLTLGDLDFKKRVIHVNHQLQRSKADIKSYYIETPKTASGSRKLPMTDTVYQAFETIIKNRKVPKEEPIIDGISGFLFYTHKGKPFVSSNWENFFKAIWKKYNASNPEPLPVVTPHTCRHTFCTIMARRGMSPKNLQYLMGHSNVMVTYNIYTHTGYEEALNEFLKINNKSVSEM